MSYIENIPAIILRLLWCHDLEIHGPGRVVPGRNGIVQIGSVVV